jgi:preprotein translocase subunit SecF
MKLLKLVPDNTNINFMRWRNVALILSLLLSIASLALVGTKGLNLGIDFVGGQVVRVNFAQPVDIEQLRGRIGTLNVGDASIQEFGNDRTYQIRLPKPDGPDSASAAVVTKVRAFIPQAYPGAVVSAGESVSGKVSEELAWDGALAISLAMLGIAIYIWIRFEWQFGVGALLTLFHDVSVVLGFFALTQLQVDLNIVAAFLAIVGYSLNDTVVVFDRIREYLRKYKQMPLADLIDFSINSVLPRTLLTSVTTLLALIALYIFGGEVLKGFTLAMIWGVVIATYSSIFSAASLLALLGVNRDAIQIQPSASKTAGARP